MKLLQKIFKFAALFVSVLAVAWGGAFAYQYRALSQVFLYQPENANIPVLVYHEIAPSSNCRFSMPVATFKKQMDYLKKEGYTTFTVDSFYEHLKTNTPFPKNSVILTFDDAWTGQFEYALPILRQNGFTATFYIPVGNVDAQRPVDPYGKIMSWNQIEEMAQLGFDLESHTMYHKKLNRVDPITAFKEIWLSRISFARALKRPVNHISYPHGSFNPFVESLAVIAGYKTGALTSGAFNTKFCNLKISHFVRIKRKELMGNITDEYFKAVLKNLDYFDHLK